MFGIVRNLLKYRGTHVLTCPDNHEHVAVKVGLLQGGSQPRLKSCTRWPEKEGCDQACVGELEASPHQTLVQAIAADWYLGKRCVYCQSAIEDIVWHERPPALRAPDGKTRQWTAVAPHELHEVLATYLPVCYRCHVTESFRRDHIEWVIERPPHVEEETRLEPTEAVY